MSKIVFLDIDGVLNSRRTVVAFGSYPYTVTGLDRAKFDEVSVRLISGIIETAGAKVVLSSTWRKDGNWHEIGPALGIPIIDKTPVGIGPRGSEIAQWLSEHAEVEQYAIVDDDSDMLPEQLPFFVQTSGFEGFSWVNAEKLAGLLGINIYDVRALRMRKPDEKTEWIV